MVAAADRWLFSAGAPGFFPQIDQFGLLAGVDARLVWDHRELGRLDLHSVLSLVHDRRLSRTVFDSSEIPDEIVDVLVVREEFADSHPNALRAVVEGWLKANDLINAQRSDVLHEVAARLKISDAELALVLRDLKIPSAGENVALLAAGGGLASTGKKLIPVLERRNRAAFNVTASQLLTAEYLPEAVR